ncbi:MULTISPECIES: hypothetical protein [Amycolatopsis]|uniref:hypothetical protein n=1 Tax=Amycolatopsis TaxID=1813 RepID=UPI00106EB191|nr:MULTISPECIES: hypothetical protein [Amycolatopsis]MCG3754167.1 hypothetical protein [Amycolatopsis sp. Poz14]
MKVIQHILRHSSIKVTMDLYTNVAQEVAANAAQKLASAIPRRAAVHSRARTCRFVVPGPCRSGRPFPLRFDHAAGVATC